jgi:hypothetical protein
VGDNAWIIEFGDNAIRNVSLTFARSTGKKHDVRELEGLTKCSAQGGGVVMNDSQSSCPSQFPHRVAEDLAVES